LGDARDIERLPEGRHADGNGLYLAVRGASRTWQFRTKDNWIGIGPTHTISPEKAREKARECREMLLNGVDPLQDKRTRLADAEASRHANKAFREVAEEWLEIQAKTWKPATLSQVKPRFYRRLYPVVGDEPISRFDMRPKRSAAVGLVDKVLAPLRETGRLVLSVTIQQYIRGILDLAIARNYGDLAGSSNAAAVTAGAPLSLLQPKLSEIYVPTSHAAFPWQDIAKLVLALRKYTWTPTGRRACQVCGHPERAAINEAIDAGVGDYRIASRFGVTPSCIISHKLRDHERSERQVIRPVAAYALEFVILTAVRNAQACGCRWDEIDWENGIWRSEDHKTREMRINRRGESVLAGEPHVVPLSKAAMTILRELQGWQKRQGIRSEYVFTTVMGSSSGHLAHTSINVWLRGFKRKRPEFAHIEFTPHGCRTAFKSWARSEGYPEIDSEMALAHVVGKRGLRGYAADADTLERRRVMMEKWADHCTRVGPTPDVVVPFRKQAR
jgi:integrase